METQPNERPNIDLAFGLANRLDNTLGPCRPSEACLNLQFFLWKNTLGFNIHPSIPVHTLGTIADVGTCTGMWALEVASECPNAHVDGFDSDVMQAPHRQWLPSNVTIRRWSMVDIPPSDIHRKYDMVHVRLACMALDPHEVGLFLENVIKILKPGGYFQWDDFNYVDMHVRYTPSCRSAPALERIREELWDDGRGDWLLLMPDTLRTGGFEETRLQKYPDLDCLARACNDGIILTMTEMVSTAQEFGTAEQAASISDTVTKAKREIIHGAALRIPRFVCVARKPRWMAT
ncbi:hypothetical protein MMC10_008824 [Thelotrema lepadinum]|nr:hypothetical protein [Thelotrema lepadinum]